MKDFVIAATYVLVLIAAAIVWRWWWGRKALTRPYGRYQGRWSGREFIPAPGGMFPVPFDDELLASRLVHPPVHGTRRANGERYCVRCGGWFREQAFSLEAAAERLGDDAIIRWFVVHTVCGYAADDLTEERPQGDPEPESYDDKI